jgi:ABC-type dipeptide/oligopeptide/nickel transport system permease component
LVVRIALMVLRLAVLVNLVTGIIFWTGNADSLQLLHIILGLLAVLSLFTIGIAQGLRGGSFGLALATFVVGFLLAFVGLFQKNWLPEPNANHWIIQVIHLVLGLAAIGLGEMIGGQYRRMRARVKAA